VVSELQARLQAALGDAYHLDRELARGGMSRLFLATEASLNRQVVVKVLPPEIVSEVSTERFKQEIELAAHLQHPNILPVLAAGTRDNLLYYVVPYVAGESLRHRMIREGRLPVSDAIRILHEVADALAYAHAEGIIHRDIKPANILLEGSHAVLTDFGVARALGQARSGGRLTDTGLAVGTPGYMAPEQAAGDRQIDGRADVYALAVVGYEMLAGFPPYAGASPQAVVAAHLTETPRPLLDSRPEVPPAVAGAIARALAKDPNARLRTAAELRDALAPAQADARVRRVSRRVMQGLVSLVLLLGGAATLLYRRSSPTTLDPTLLAVAPFDVLGPSLTLWREGLVDLLSRSLDGAGPLRTVSPTVVIRRWNGRADPSSASALGNRTGAGLSVFGSLVSAGGDSVRVDATLFDVARERKLGEVQLIGDSRHMDRLVDSLAVNILRELGRTQDISAVRTAGLRATSLPALKAFLEGEQLYRRGSWDSAQGAYRRALALDSMFVPAIRHLAKSLWWRAPGDRMYVPLLRRAGELNHGLPRRDSLLVTADSISAALDEVEDLPAALRRSLSARLFSTLEEAARVYPEDPEVWYELGEARFHTMGGPTRAQALEAFDRSIALDSNFAPAYAHPMHLGLALYGLEGWHRYARPYFALNPADDFLRLLDVILTNPERSEHIDSLIRAARVDRILDAVLASWEYPDSAETAVRLARALVSARGHATGFARDTTARRKILAAALAYRGHLREAQELIEGEDNLGPWIAPLPAEIALVGGSMPDSSAAMYKRRLRERPSQSPGGPPARGVHALMFALPWWAARRDTLSLAHFARRADWALRTVSQPIQKEIAQYGVAAARAYSALARGDTAAALSRFSALPHDIGWGHLSRVPEGQILARMGRDAEALKLFDLAFPSDGWAGPVKVLTRLESARVAERLGPLKRAATDYQYVVDAWRHADAELKPYVSEARQGLARLTSEPRS
jgi:tetratricopeptide (TPR) repeat protein